MLTIRNLRPIVAALVATMAMLTLSACAPGNTVRLLYAPPDASILPMPNAPRVAVVMFEDKRSTMQIGERRDGSSFVASAPVADWVARNLADELTRRGLQVSYATTLDHARTGNPDFIVTGIVNDVTLREVKTTDFTSQMSLGITLSGRKGRIFSETLSSSQSRQVIPAPDVAEKLLSDTLREVIQPAARKISSAVQ